MAAVATQMELAAAPESRLSTIDDLLDRMRGYVRGDLSVVRRAYDFAAKAHEGQRRGTGEPYVQHPLETALLLADLQLDRATIAAGLLHDVPEDTSYTLAQIEEEFGAEISRLSWASHEEQQAENLRKMFLAMAEDIRVVLIKLCDRLHNVRTLDGKPPEDRQRIARETLEIYAPLAHRLGIWELKWRLEDAAFAHLEPERYQELKRLLNETRRAREQQIAEAIAILSGELQKAGLKAEVSGRPKH